MTEPPVGPSARPPVLLGIDCGGSHTTVVVGDGDANVLARAEGPPSAMRPGGADASAAVIADTARRAASQAGVTLPAEAAMVGAAGAGREPEQRDLAAALVTAGVARTVRVAGDSEVALSAAFGDEPGILINAGTGSIAFARSPDGRLHRAGGYGWQLGDEGGGYWLGRRALAAAARAHDEVEESSTLLERLLVALSLRDLDALIRWTVTASPAQVAALAPHVLNAAREGEAVAQAAVSDAARELARLVRALARHFPAGDAIPVATAGALLRPGSLVLAGLQAALGSDEPRARLIDGPVDAPVGALRLAARLA
ncbi:MAG TPA: BadF/BadG/BcrA/BcrD ATPase family protein [Gemmatimonadales bacterium]|jgi:N-acetylglucosamine kinase-like BadF-type ATPase|nr:BadF/BadG/BcrA/BcrD ATPase family protein [Gemmatimonadales bacterium]